jgi:hypothetical protein
MKLGVKILIKYFNKYFSMTDALSILPKESIQNI